MDRTWYARIIDAIRESGRTPREVSLAAGLGANYVEQLKKETKNPRLYEMIRLCDELKVSPIYIIFGLKLTPETEEALRLLSDLPEESKRKFLDFVRSFRSLQP